MKSFAIIIILLGALIFFVGYIGSQHQVAQMLRGSPAPVQSGLAINPSGSGNTGGVSQVAATPSSQTPAGGAVAT